MQRRDRGDRRRVRCATWARAIKHAMAAAEGRAEGARVSARVKEALRYGASADRGLQRGRRGARGLAGPRAARAAGAARLRDLPARQPRHARRRGRGGRQRRRPSCASCRALVGRGHELGPATVESVASVLGESGSRRPRCSRTSSGATATCASRPSRSTRSATWTRSASTPSPSASARPAPARRSSPSPWPSPRCRAARSTASSSPAPPSRPASASASCPGDLMAKVDPYLRPLFDAMNDMLDPERVTAHLEKGVIEVAPLAFMRGRTLNDSFVILDEAQNTSPEQMKMFLTRLGFGSQMVVNGDVSQIDLPREQRSGLVEVGEILRGVEGVGVDALRQRGRRAAQARPADRPGLRRPRGAGRAGSAQCRSVELDVDRRRASTPRARRGARRRSRSRPPAIERRPPRGRVRRAPTRIAELNARVPRQGRADGRAVVPGRRGRRRRTARASSATS